MSTDAARIRRGPAIPRLGERIAVAALERVMPGLEGGTLVVRLPNGRERRFGSGPEIRMEIHDGAFFRRLATRPRFALGESYQAGEWDADDLPGFVELLARNSRRAAARHPALRRFAAARPRINRRTGPLAAKRNIQYHYDLGNDLFALFLDETMTYSCAVFERPDEPLADAQRRKLRLLAGKLDLGPDDHVLEIGCGWGSFALVAAGERGARVTGITLSPSQAEVARRRVAEAGLERLVEIRVQDFREVEGTFTRVASIEMLEAIGEKQFASYFGTIERVLAPGGRAAVQTILIPDERYEGYRTSPDWIERYVFPGCLIPSLGALAEASGRLRIERVEEIGQHYGETLARWREVFLGRLDEVRGLGYGEHFVRTWDFYLASCEGLFRAGHLRDVQLELAR